MRAALVGLSMCRMQLASSSLANSQASDIQSAPSRFDGQSFNRRLGEAAGKAQIQDGAALDEARQPADSISNARVRMAWR